MQGLGLDEEPFPSFPDSRPPKTAPRPRITAHSVTWNRRSQQIQGIMARGGIRRGQAIAPEGFGLTPEALTRPMTSASLFGNDAPLELEVGSGNGTLLVTESKARAGVNFLGIEYTRRYWRYAADRLRRNDCENARVVLADAATLISRLHLRRHELDVVRLDETPFAMAGLRPRIREIDVDRTQAIVLEVVPSSPVKKSRFCSRRKFGGQVQGRCDSAERPS